VVYVERGGKGLQILVAEDDLRLAPAMEALVESVQRSRIRKLAIERVNGEPVVGSAYEDTLLDLGFRAGPRKLTLTA
jgi:ATP-dependent Lhr-like helicase